MGVELVYSCDVCKDVAHEKDFYAGKPRWTTMNINSPSIPGVGIAQVALCSERCLVNWHEKEARRLRGGAR